MYLITETAWKLFSYNCPTAALFGIVLCQSQAKSTEIPVHRQPKILCRFILAPPRNFCLTCNQNNSNLVTVCIAAKALSLSSRQCTRGMTGCRSCISGICQGFAVRWWIKWQQVRAPRKLERIACFRIDLTSSSLLKYNYSSGGKAPKISEKL